MVLHISLSEASKNIKKGKRSSGEWSHLVAGVGCAACFLLDSIRRRRQEAAVPGW